MQAFKAFGKVVKRNIVVLMVYLAISLGLSVLMSQEDAVGQVFEETKLNVCVMDEDHSKVSEAFVTFIEDNHVRVELSDDIDTLQDAFYYGDVDYLVRIPAGYGEALMKGEDATMEVTANENASGSVYVDNQLDAFLSTYHAYSKMGLSDEEVTQRTLDALKVETNVFIEENHMEGVNAPKFQGFFRMLPYAFVAIMVHGIASVMLAFNKEEVSKRMKCSSTSSLKISLQFVLGCAIMAVVVWALCMGIMVLMFKDLVFDYFAIKWLLKNSLAMMAAALGLGFLAGSLSKNEAYVSIFGVCLAMFTSFLGGVFVPLSSIGEGTKKFARFIPTFWYTQNCEALYNTSVITDSFQETFNQGIVIQLSFAAAAIAVAVLVMREKKGA